MVWPIAVGEPLPSPYRQPPRLAAVDARRVVKANDGVGPRKSPCGTFPAAGRANAALRRQTNDTPITREPRSHVWYEMDTHHRRWRQDGMQLRNEGNVKDGIANNAHHASHASTEPTCPWHIDLCHIGPTLGRTIVNPEPMAWAEKAGNAALSSSRYDRSRRTTCSTAELLERQRPGTAATPDLLHIGPIDGQFSPAVANQRCIALGRIGGNCQPLLQSVSFLTSHFETAHHGHERGTRSRVMALINNPGFKSAHGC